MVKRRERHRQKRGRVKDLNHTNQDASQSHSGKEADVDPKKKSLSNVHFLTRAQVLKPLGDQ